MKRVNGAKNRQTFTCTARCCPHRCPVSCNCHTIRTFATSHCHRSHLKHCDNRMRIISTRVVYRTARRRRWRGEMSYRRTCTSGKAEHLSFSSASVQSAQKTCIRRRDARWSITPGAVCSPSPTSFSVLGATPANKSTRSRRRARTPSWARPNLCLRLPKRFHKTFYRTSRTDEIDAITQIKQLYKLIIIKCIVINVVLLSSD